MLCVEGRRYQSVTNIGFRPTVNLEETAASLSIETHALDRLHDVYGKEVTLEFLVRLRDERRFSGEQALVAQIQKDVGNARRYFRWLERMNRPV
jgi:riboflavin kinase/FMN adenylyltransferase